ncbi:MAG: hypothetical protein ACW99A_12025 [Candidatus Kariarchaeaceae archaeon]
MLSVINFLNKIHQFLDDCKTSSNFFIRKRLYKGKPGEYIGLKHYHNLIIELLQELNERPIDNTFLFEKSPEFKEISSEIMKSLELLPYLVEKDKDKDNINKILQHFDSNLFKLIEFIDNVRNYDQTKIIDPQFLKIKELKEKIEDNINQLSWKRSTTITSNTKPNTYDNLEQYYLMSSLRQCLIIEEVEYLTLLALIMAKIREVNFKDKNQFYNYLNFYLTLAKVFSKEGMKIGSLTKDDVKQDIERYINLNRLNWLVKLHNSIDESFHDEELIINFVQKLYLLARDPKEEFLWTMLTIARGEDNIFLEKISVDYAILAATLLSLTYDLRMYGMIDLTNAIKNISTISALDAIDDLMELYLPNEVQVEQLIKAMTKKLQNLKEFAYQIIQMEDLKSKFEIYIGLSGSGPGTSTSLEEYIQNMGIYES